MTRVFGAVGWITIIETQALRLYCHPLHQPSTQQMVCSKSGVETQGLRLDRPPKPEQFKINEKDLTMKRKKTSTELARRKRGIGSTRKLTG